MSILDRLGSVRRFMHTLTRDRCDKFADDHGLEEHLQTQQVHFPNPRSPWQRGRSERFNGLLRQFYLRQRDFNMSP